MSKKKYFSEYILESEYRCSHCDGLPPDFKPKDLLIVYHILFDRFDTIRREWGKPISISSGYRCPVWNAMVSNVMYGVHPFGLALDLDFKNAKEVDDAYKLINDIYPELRMGIHKTDGSFIHIDIGYFISPRATADWREGARWRI